MKKIIKTIGILGVIVIALLISKKLSITTSSSPTLIESTAKAASKTFSFSYTENYVEVDSSDNKIAEYSTLSDALSGCADGDTIYAMNDVTESGNALIDIEKNIELNLNSHIISGLSNVVNTSTGTLTIDGNSDGSIDGSIINGATGKIIILNANLTINTIQNSSTGTITIENCEITNLSTASAPEVNNSSAGTINIKDSNFKAVVTNIPAIYNAKSGTTNIDNVRIEGYGISNEGNMEIYGCEIEYSGGNAGGIINSGSMYIHDKNENNKECELHIDIHDTIGLVTDGIYNTGTLTSECIINIELGGSSIAGISNSGTLDAAGIEVKSDSKVEDTDTAYTGLNNNGTLSADYINIDFQNGKIVTATGIQQSGKINCDKINITINGEGKTICGISFSSSVDTSIENADVNVKNTYSDGTTYGIYDSSKKVLNMDNVNVNVSAENGKGYGVYNSNSGTVNILGGKYTETDSNGYGVYNYAKGIINIGADDSSVSKNIPEIITENSTPLGKTAGTINFYDGILKYNKSVENSSVDGMVTTVPSGYSIKHSISLVDTNLVATAYLSDGTSEPYSVYSGTTLKGTYATLQEAFDAASDGDRIEVTDGVTESAKGASISEEKNITLNLNDHNLGNMGTIENKSTGTLTINGDTDGTNGIIDGQITNSGSGSIVINKMIAGNQVLNSGDGILNMNSSKIISNSYGVINASTGVVYIKDSDILAFSYHGLFNNSTGTINVENTNITVKNGDGCAICNNSTGSIIFNENTTKTNYIKATLYGINNSGGGTVKVNYADIDVTTWAAVSNSATMELSNCKIHGHNNYTVTNNGNITLNYCDIDNDNSVENRGVGGISNYGTLTMNHGSVTCTSSYEVYGLDAIYTYNGTSTINDVDINVETCAYENTAPNIRGIYTYKSTTTIKDADVNVTSKNGYVYGIDLVEPNDYAEITNCVVTASNSGTGKCYGIYTEQSMSNVLENTNVTSTTSGSAENYGIYLNGTYVITLQNNNITASNTGTGNCYGLYVYNNSVIIIDGGSIHAKSDVNNECYGVYLNNSSIIQLGENDGNISITSPEIICDSAQSTNSGGIYWANSERYINFFDGIVKEKYNKDNLINGSNSMGIPANAELVNDTETIDGETYYTAYLGLIPGWYWNNSTKTISRECTDGYTSFSSTATLKEFIASHKDVQKIDFTSDEKIVIPDTDFKELFKDCTKLTEIVALDNIESSATDLTGMFENCSSLTSIDMGDIHCNWDGLTSMKNMFKGCSSLTDVDMENIDTYTSANTGNVADEFIGDNSGAGTETSEIIDLTSMFEDCTSLKYIELYLNFSATRENYTNFFKGCISLIKPTFYYVYMNPISTASMFENCTALVDSGMQWYDSDIYTWLSNVNFAYNESAASMFKNCSSMKNLDLRYFEVDTTAENAMTDFFTGMDSLNRIALFTELTDDCGLTGETWLHTGDGTMLFSDYNNYTAEELIDEGLNGIYINAVLDGHYYKSSYGSLNNLYEVHNPDKLMTGYCINLHRTNGFGTYLDRTLVTTGEELVNNYLCTAEEGSTHGTGTIGTDMRQVLITLMYYGYSNDADGLQAKYGLTDSEFQQVTQNAIWDFNDRYDNPSGPTMFTGNQLLAYNELTTKKYSDIPNADSLLFYVYDSKDDTQQNMISLASVDDQPYAGVEVKKVDENGNPVSGAVFNVINESTGDTYTMTSNSEGIASICRADHIYGLVAGVYAVQEVTAPRGYSLSTDYYEFQVTSDNANTVIQIGYKNGEDYQDIMTFVDSDDESVIGGGIKVRNTSTDGEAIVGAEYTIYADAACTEIVATLTTDADGVAMSGDKDFEPGTYYVKETGSVYGYAPSTTVSELAVVADTYSELTSTSTEKTGTAIIEADKVLDGEDISKFKFTYQLLDDEGNVIQTKTTDSKGHVKFDAITFKTSDGTYKNYTVREVSGTEAYIDYDTHSENVTVMISDEGGDNLVCTPVYDSDGAVFTNKILNSGVTVSKTVTGNKGDTTKDFEYTFTIDNSDTIVATKTLADKTTKTVELKNGSTFTLKDGEKIAFSIKRGSTYSVTEESTLYETTINGKFESTYTSTIGATDETVNFVNNLSSAPLSGVNDNGFIVFIKFIVAFAGCGLLMMVIKKHVKFEKLK